MSRRLFAVIVMALVMGLVFGGLRVADAERSAAQFGQASQLAKLAGQDIVLIQDLQDERDLTVGLAQADSGALKSLYARTDAEAAVVRQAAAAIGGAFPANIRADVAGVLADISPGRIAALHRTLSANEDGPAMITSYAVPVGDMITLNDQIAQGTPDSALVNDVRALNFLSLAKEQVSQQRALLYNLFNDPYFIAADQSPTDSGELAALTLANSEEFIDEATLQTTATPAENALFYDALNTPGSGEAEEIESFILANAPTQPATGPVVPDPLDVITALGFSLKQAPQQWFQAMSAKINAMQAVGQSIAGNIAARASSLQQGAQRSALITALFTALVLFVVLTAALLVARSLVLPLRRLRAGALDIASVQLPERIMHLSESPDPAANLDVAPINVLTADEIGQVARAFDQVHAEAVRLAGNEAMLRGTFNAVFVNLSRRSQALIERLALLIDSLELNEDDPGRLSSLFSMDHLVTRMRRNSENLLLLAGHEGARRWSDPVALADVARAANSEIEQYARVVFDIQPGIAIIGHAVSDVVHLLAELIENATAFSPGDSQVLVSAQELGGGGLLMQITDTGIGVSEVRLAEMNWRLDEAPAIDASVSRHMGLFAVARLAERHGVRVRLRPAVPQGLTALVWLPEGVIVRTPRGYASPIRRSEPVAAPGHLGLSRSPGGIFARSDVEDHQAADHGAIGDGWHSGTDPLVQQRHAARIIAAPIRGGQTAAGLPVRVPQANLLPGSAGDARPGAAGRPDGGWPAPGDEGQEPQAPLPQSPAEIARGRLGGFQSGARRAEGQQQRPGERAAR